MKKAINRNNNHQSKWNQHIKIHLHINERAIENNREKEIFGWRSPTEMFEGNEKSKKRSEEIFIEERKRPHVEIQSKIEENDHIWKSNQKCGYLYWNNQNGWKCLTKTHQMKEERRRRKYNNQCLPRGIGSWHQWKIIFRFPHLPAAPQREKKSALTASKISTSINNRLTKPISSINGIEMAKKRKRSWHRRRNRNNRQKKSEKHQYGSQRIGRKSMKISENRPTSKLHEHYNHQSSHSKEENRKKCLKRKPPREMKHRQSKCVKRNNRNEASRNEEEEGVKYQPEEKINREATIINQIENVYTSR